MNQHTQHIPPEDRDLVDHVAKRSTIYPQFKQAPFNDREYLDLCRGIRKGLRGFFLITELSPTRATWRAMVRGELVVVVYCRTTKRVVDVLPFDPSKHKSKKHRHR